MKGLLILLVAVSTAIAQTPPATTPVAPATGADANPTYVMAAGVGYAPYTPGLAALSGVGIFAVRIGGSNLFSWSTMTMVPGQKTGATLRTGAGYMVYQKGPWSLTAIADAGIATGGTVTLGTFSGGGLLAYEVNQAQHLYLTGGLSIVQVSSGIVTPNFYFGFAKGF